MQHVKTIMLNMVHPVKLKYLLNKQEESSLVINFSPIFDAWMKGKCTTKYLQQYVEKQTAQAFIQEFERRTKCTA